MVNRDFEAGEWSPCGLDAPALASVAKAGDGKQVVEIRREVSDIEIAGENDWAGQLANEFSNSGEVGVALLRENLRTGR